MSNTKGVERTDLTKNTYITVGEGKISLLFHKGNICASVEGEYRQATIIKGMPCLVFRNLKEAAVIGTNVEKDNCDTEGESVVVEFKTLFAIEQVRDALNKVEKELLARQKSGKV